MAKQEKHFGNSFAFDACHVWNDVPDSTTSKTNLSSTVVYFN